MNRAFGCFSLKKHSLSQIFLRQITQHITNICEKSKTSLTLKNHHVLR